MLTLRDLVEREGWRYVEVEAPCEEPSRLGSPQRDPLCFAQACAGNVLAVKPNSAGHAFYAAAHEIAEARHDFSGHHQHVWREQCNILARWCRQLYVATRSAAPCDHGGSERTIDRATGEESCGDCGESKRWQDSGADTALTMATVP